MTYSYEAVVSHLKQALKKRNLSYAELAERLGMSESGVKKIMTNDDVSLGRLAGICEAAEIDLFDLLQVAWKSPPTPFILTDEQRALFEAHPGCYNFHRALLDAHMDADKVRDLYDLDQRSVTLYLGALEDLGLVSVLPTGKLRSAVPAPYRMGGAPEQVVRTNIEKFVHHSFDLDKDRRHQLKAQLRMTADHHEAFRRELHDLVLRYGVMAHQDELTCADDALLDVAVLTIIARCATRAYLTIPRVSHKLR